MAAPSVQSALMQPLHDAGEDGGRHRKVSIIGAGAVGLACAYSIINQGACSELVLIDIPAMEEKLRGEVMDLQHGAAFTRHVIIKGSSDYAATAGSDLVVITAGARQREGETRLSLVERNLAIFKGMVPHLARASPRCVMCVVSNPVDIMTYITARLSGFPAGRVFGSGTSLDSSRFRTLIADRLHVDTRSVHGMIIGEHGDSSVACWSSLNVGGVRMRDIKPSLGRADDPDAWNTLHGEVVQAAYEIIKAKGFTNFAIGVTVANLVTTVLRNERGVRPLSVPVKGRYGIVEDVYLSLPAVLGIDGVSDVLNLTLDADEEAKLRSSAATIGKVQAALDFSM